MSFKDNILLYLGDSGPLTNADRLLAGEVIDSFAGIWKENSGHDPELGAEFARQFVYPLLKPLGFRSHLYDNWTRDWILSEDEILRAKKTKGVAAERNFFKYQGD